MTAQGGKAQSLGDNPCPLPPLVWLSECPSLSQLPSLACTCVLRRLIPPSAIDGGENVLSRNDALIFQPANLGRLSSDRAPFFPAPCIIHLSPHRPHEQSARVTNSGHFPLSRHAQGKKDVSVSLGMIDLSGSRRPSRSPTVAVSLGRKCQRPPDQSLSLRGQTICRPHAKVLVTTFPRANAPRAWLPKLGHAAAGRSTRGGGSRLLGPEGGGRPGQSHISDGQSTAGRLEAAAVFDIRLRKPAKAPRILGFLPFLQRAALALSGAGDCWTDTS
jgi:hypothetical protein